MKLAAGPLREPEFRLLFAARTVSMSGSAMAPVALAFAVLDTLHGSATDVGYVLVARQAPVIVLLLVGGVWADRVPRHRVMVGSNLVSGSAQAGLAALLLTQHAQLWNLIVLSGVNAGANAFFFPASTGIVPQTVHETLLQTANSMLRLSLNGANIAGAALGGIVVSAVGPGWAIAFDAASFLAAAAITARMRIPALLREAGSTMLHELRVGWHDFWSRTWLWSIVLQFSLLIAAEGAALDVLGPKVSKTHFGGAGAYGAILAATVAGSVVTGVLLLRWRPRRTLLTATFAIMPLALPMLAFARPEPPAVVAVASFVAGAGLGIFGVLWDTTMQQEIPQDRLSRLSAYDALGSICLSPLGMAAAGPLAAAVGFRDAFLICAAVVVGATLPVFGVRDVRTMTRRV